MVTTPESVDVAELGGLGLGGAGHAGELVVEPEIVLQRDRTASGSRADLHALFGLDGLVQPLVAAAPEQDPPVHDQHLTVGDDVVLLRVNNSLAFSALPRWPTSGELFNP